MLTLDSYLSLSVADAQKQWLSVMARSAVPSGGRQVDFLPIETLICYGLGLVARPTPSGTVNIQTSARDVLRFASLFRRTPKSLAAKLSNLDGRRPHGAKFEQQLWIELTTTRDTFPALYETVLASARSVGLGHEDVPDFLGHAEHALDIVFDAVSVNDSALFKSIEPEVRRLAESVADIDVASTERAMMGTARVGQQQFARRVLTSAGYHCVFCGLSTRAQNLPSSRMLVASHIKPWSESSGRERVDPLNGLAACPTHDAAFESHLLTIDSSRVIIRSPSLERAVATDSVWAQFFGENALSPELILPEGASAPGLGYVDWHRARLVVELPDWTRRKR
ncbi:HNH endonuclease signature motif containing protein [Microbacterium sp. STN6]|uniref:HNH endonuclease n=1 Tax=Microbacterium sp. STN6 TaxID=2995588 RepID=UPI002260A260|nr:HNH endonuclease signature motif containing protein [Microbacterium sp. STN6]MCX7522593.1 HNH endonuclease signature motif containing protein [Microbacterium sp. STN6]